MATLGQQPQRPRSAGARAVATLLEPDAPAARRPARRPADARSGPCPADRLPSARRSTCSSRPATTASAPWRPARRLRPQTRRRFGSSSSGPPHGGRRCAGVAIEGNQQGRRGPAFGHGRRDYSEFERLRAGHPRPSSLVEVLRDRVAQSDARPMQARLHGRHGDGGPPRSPRSTALRHRGSGRPSDRFPGAHRRRLDVAPQLLGLELVVRPLRPVFV